MIGACWRAVCFAPSQFLARNTETTIGDSTEADGGMEKRAVGIMGHGAPWSHLCIGWEMCSSAISVAWRTRAVGTASNTDGNIRVGSTWKAQPQLPIPILTRD